MKNGGLVGKRLRKTPAIARMMASAGEKSRLDVLQKNAARTLIPGFNTFEPFYAVRNATLVGMVQAIDRHGASFCREEAVLREEVRRCQPFEHLFALYTNRCSLSRETPRNPHRRIPEETRHATRPPFSLPSEDASEQEPHSPDRSKPARCNTACADSSKKSVSVTALLYPSSSNA